MRVYLAGPDVFAPEPERRFAAMRLLCRAHGLQAVSPLDAPAGEMPAADAPGIARANEAHIRHCHAVLANLTPFRGPGADAGTAYEVGFARALGRPVFGWANVSDGYADRVRTLTGTAGPLDGDGLQIEDWGLFENLMISCGIAAGGGVLLARSVPDRWGDLSVFGECVAAAAAALLGRQVPAAAGMPAAGRRTR